MAPRKKDSGPEIRLPFKGARAIRVREGFVFPDVLFNNRKWVVYMLPQGAIEEAELEIIEED